MCQYWLKSTGFSAGKPVESLSRLVTDLYCFSVLIQVCQARGSLYHNIDLLWA